MEKKTTVKTTGGIGFCGLLTILFIALKLCGVIDWAWIWVLAPAWISLALGIVIMIIAIIIIAILNR